MAKDIAVNAKSTLVFAAVSFYIFPNMIAQTSNNNKLSWKIKTWISVMIC